MSLTKNIDPAAAAVEVTLDLKQLRHCLHHQLQRAAAAASKLAGAGIVRPMIYSHSCPQNIALQLPKDFN